MRHYWYYPIQTKMIFIMKKRHQKIRTGILLVSFFLFPAIFYFFSPYLIIDDTLNGVITGSFIVFALQFTSALVLGRGFCGWVCPAGGAHEALITVRTKKVTKGNFIKWLIGTPWIAVIILLAVQNGGYYQGRRELRTK
jgi:ferredoxin-type protein NapH